MEGDVYKGAVERFSQEVLLLTYVELFGREREGISTIYTMWVITVSSPTGALTDKLG